MPDSERRMNGEFSRLVKEIHEATIATTTQLGAHLKTFDQHVADNKEDRKDFVDFRELVAKYAAGECPALKKEKGSQRWFVGIFFIAGMFVLALLTFYFNVAGG